MEFSFNFQFYWSSYTILHHAPIFIFHTQPQQDKQRKLRMVELYIYIYIFHRYAYIKLVVTNPALHQCWKQACEKDDQNSNPMLHLSFDLRYGSRSVSFQLMCLSFPDSCTLTNSSTLVIIQANGVKVYCCCHVLFPWFRELRNSWARRFPRFSCDFLHVN